MKREPSTPPTRRDSTGTLADRFRDIRQATVQRTQTLSAEDMQVQSMPDVSPTKWHLGHTSWFFETFLLEPLPGYRPFDPAYREIFNSYYLRVGDRLPRPERGLLSRPALSEVLRYRRHVDEAMLEALERGRLDDQRALVELGLQHEQQHQELLLMDIQDVLSRSPLHPSYTQTPPPARGQAPAQRWHRIEGGIHSIGDDGGSGFAFDNEGPVHEVLVRPFELAHRPLTNGELLEFVLDGGYDDARLWLDDASPLLGRAPGWDRPHLWLQRDGQWWQFTMHGLEPLRLEDPATHLSYYEADAIARWAGARLPTEFEWEVAAKAVTIEGNFVETGAGYPRPVSADDPDHPVQLFGDVWEWTRSAYAPYPGYRPARGAVGEYNGKFMVNQMVLRGGCWASPRAHLRRSYRNFFHPDKRWHFGGLRLARDPD